MKKGTSVLPLVMGLVGGVLAIPSAVCSGACAAGLAATTETIDSTTAGNIIMGLGIVGGVFGIIGGILGKPLPIPSGILLLLGVIFLAVSSFLTLNLLGIICVILVLLGAIFAFTQKKQEI
jgi:hypothetical protein